MRFEFQELNKILFFVSFLCIFKTHSTQKASFFHLIKRINKKSYRVKKLMKIFLSIHFFTRCYCFYKLYVQSV